MILTDYYISLADKILGKDEKSLKNKKNDTEDPLKVEKAVEAAQLTLAKVLTYQMPEYNELEIVGKCRWKVLYLIKRYFQNTTNSNHFEFQVMFFSLSPLTLKEVGGLQNDPMGTDMVCIPSILIKTSQMFFW